MNVTPPTLPTTFPAPRNPLRLRTVIFRILLALFLVLLPWHIIWRIGNARAVTRLVKAARDKGEPMNFKQLAATYPPVPDSSNAYVALRTIWAVDDPEFWEAFDNGERPTSFKPAEFLPKDIPSFGRTRYGIHPSEKMDAATLSLIQNYLQTNRAVMTAVHEALKRPAFRAPIQFEDGMAALLPHLSNMKQEGYLLRLDAISASESGKVDDALNDIEDVGKLGHCLKDDPFLIGHLVRLALYSIAMEGAERIVSQHQLTEPQLIRLSKIIASLECMDGLKRALIGERAMTFGFFESPERTFLHSQDSSSAESEDRDSPEVSAAKSAEGIRVVFGATGLLAADKRMMAETYSQAITCAESPSPASNDEFDRVFNNVSSNAWKFPPKYFSAMLLPSLSKAGEKFSRVEAMRRCALATLAVERYKLRNNGALPDTLTAVPAGYFIASTQDTFAAQPLHYKKLPAGYIIYSVGPDRTDNDGLLDTPKKGPLPLDKDVGFGVERP